MEKINERAIDVLTRELGVAATLRFIMPFSSGEGNYTEERDALFEGLTLEELVKDVQASQQHRGR